MGDAETAETFATQLRDLRNEAVTGAPKLRWHEATYVRLFCDVLLFLLRRTG